MAKPKKTNDYEVGYGRPPKAGQFKKGTSGNPNGRPKKKLTIQEQIFEALNGSKLTVTENGEKRKVSATEGMTKAMIAKALKGDTRAFSVLIKNAVANSKEEPWETTAKDEADLDRLLAEYGNDNQNGGESG